jgi:hypothetical protein
MKYLLVILALLLLVLIPTAVHAQTVCCATSAQAEQHSDGLFHLVLSGDQAEIALICSYGDCSLGFGSRYDALDYWRTLLNARYGIFLVPLPLPSG